MKQRVGFIGYNDLSAALVAKLTNAGFEVAELSLVTPRKKAQKKSIARIVAEADIIITLLANPQEVEELYFSSGGILELAKPGDCCIDLSFNTPRGARELYALASVHDCFFIEAAFVEANGLTHLFVGGESPIIERFYPVLDALSDDVLVTGIPGTASAAKISSIITQASALMGLVEGLTFALNNHVNTDSITKLLAIDPHVALAMRRMAQSILDEQFDEGASLELFFNELAIALDAVDDLDFALPVLETTHQLYDLLMMVGGSKKALQALALVYREEDYCVKQGLDWGLAQRAMDIYEQANEFGFDDYEDTFDDLDCGHHQRFHSDDDEFPRMNDYYSPN